MNSILSFIQSDVSWVSPALWTVPSWAATGERVLPQRGELCYIGATVKNHGIAPVDDVEVRFYRGQAGIGFDLHSAKLIGRSYVSVGACEQVDVQCMSGWCSPAAFHCQEQLVAMLYGENYECMAQRNVMLAAAKRGRFNIEIPFNEPLTEGMAAIRVRSDHPGNFQFLFQGWLKNYSHGKIESCFMEVDGNIAGSSGIDSIVNLEITKSINISGTLEGRVGVLHVEQLHAGRAITGVNVLVVDDAWTHQFDGDNYGNVITKASSGATFKTH